MLNRGKQRMVATIEARMTSTRLPGKVLMPVCGKPVLELMIERVRRIPYIDEIVIATTTNATDDPVVDLADSMNVSHYRGDEKDVLSRVLEAAQAFGADIICELTGDCPLIDPELSTTVIESYLLNSCDYATNSRVDLPYPDGCDTEVFSTSLLKVADAEGHLCEDREHVSWFFRRHPERFRLLWVPTPLSAQMKDLRITLDEESDYHLISHLFERFYHRDPAFPVSEVVKYLKANPHVFEISKGFHPAEQLRALA